MRIKTFGLNLMIKLLLYFQKAIYHPKLLVEKKKLIYLKHLKQVLLLLFFI